MKNIIVKIYLIFLVLIGFNGLVFSQSYMIDKQLSKINVSGTSSLHDWQMIVGAFSGTFDFNIDKEVVAISSLDVSVEAQSLSSNKRIMNKKTAEALEPSEYPYIKFKHQKIIDLTLENNKVSGEILGILTIKGISKEVILSFSGFIAEDKSIISINGTTSVLMTDFNVKPPVALMGTVETDDLVQIKFTIILKMIT